MKQPKQVILDALHRYGGDDLERAEMAFRHLSKEQLNQEHGQSGKTCQEILDGYKKHRSEVKNAILWANTL